MICGSGGGSTGSGGTGGDGNGATGEVPWRFDDDDDHGGPGGWWIFVEVDIRLALHDIVRPDLSGWRRERLSKPGRARPIDVVPDWVCEIVSPSTAARDRATKRALYAQHGGREALELRDERWLELGAWEGEAVVRVPPFDAIELELDRLFLPRDADPPDEDEAVG